MILFVKTDVSFIVGKRFRVYPFDLLVEFPKTPQASNFCSIWISEAMEDPCAKPSAVVLESGDDTGEAEKQGPIESRQSAWLPGLSLWDADLRWFLFCLVSNCSL